MTDIYDLESFCAMAETDLQEHGHFAYPIVVNNAWLTVSLTESILSIGGINDPNEGVPVLPDAEDADLICRALRPNWVEVGKVENGTARVYVHPELESSWAEGMRQYYASLEHCTDPGPQIIETEPC